MLNVLIAEHTILQDMVGTPRGLEGLREAALGMVKEAAEVLDEVLPGFRPWATVDEAKADKEAIDVLNYLLVYFVSRGWDEEDVWRRYMETNGRIRQRIATRTKEAADVG